MKFCTNCGSALEDDARFCTSCGQVVEAEAVNAAVSQAAQAAQVQPEPVVTPVPPVAPAQPETPVQAQPVTPPPAYTPARNYADTPATTGQPQRTRVFGKLSFIFGLIGLILSGLFGLIGLISYGIVGIYCWFGISLGIAGLIFGIIGKKKNPDDPKARSGFTLSLIAIIVGFVLFIVGMIILVAAANNGSF